MEPVVGSLFTCTKVVDNSKQIHAFTKHILLRNLLKFYGLCNLCSVKPSFFIKIEKIST